MSVSIKVSVRCRPFTCDDRLGVVLTQSSEDEGEVQLLNSTYSTTRFGFSYAWWSAYGFQRHVQGDPPEAAQMTLVNQQMAYDSVGLKIKDDLLSGNAVVLFAYGLSGSGKTYTVFGVRSLTPQGTKGGLRANAWRWWLSAGRYRHPRGVVQA
jgi:hypothetical protein